MVHGTKGVLGTQRQTVYSLLSAAEKIVFVISQGPSSCNPRRACRKYRCFLGDILVCDGRLAAAGRSAVSIAAAAHNQDQEDDPAAVVISAAVTAEESAIISAAAEQQ